MNSSIPQSLMKAVPRIAGGFMGKESVAQLQAAVSKAGDFSDPERIMQALPQMIAGFVGTERVPQLQAAMGGIPSLRAFRDDPQAILQAVPKIAAAFTRR